MHSNFPANWPFGDLLPFHYNLIVIDPAWDWQTFSPKGTKKSPTSKYKTMSLEEIAALPVGALCSGPTLLLCWGTVPLMRKQIQIVEHWGFEYKTAMMWHKVFPSGKTAMGTGYRVRSMIEPVFVATYRNPKHKAFPGLFTGIRRDHSQKPREFYRMVEQKCPSLTSRADIYARCRRPGWDLHGDELDKYPLEHSVEEVA